MTEKRRLPGAWITAAWGAAEILKKEAAAVTKLTPAEIQSGSSRQRWAEMLIEQLPPSHDGRNSWLLNYGVGEQAAKLRKARAKELDIPELTFDPEFGAFMRQHR